MDYLNYVLHPSHGGPTAPAYMSVVNNTPGEGVECLDTFVEDRNVSGSAGHTFDWDYNDTYSGQDTVRRPSDQLLLFECLDVFFSRMILPINTLTILVQNFSTWMRTFNSLSAPIGKLWPCNYIKSSAYFQIQESPADLFHFVV